jgi:hypothetical protein
MGTLSRTGIPGFRIGNTAEIILNNLECSVLAVKPADVALEETLKQDSHRRQDQDFSRKTKWPPEPTGRFNDCFA